MDNQNSSSPFLTSNGRKTITKECSNKSIEFGLYTKEEADELEKSGIYIFLNSKKTHLDIYIGQAKNLSQRIKVHPRWDEAKELGADCVAIVFVELKDLDETEKLLIKECKPALNEQYNTNSDEINTDNLRSALKKEFLMRK